MKEVEFCKDTLKYVGLYIFNEGPQPKILTRIILSNFFKMSRPWEVFLLCSVTVGSSFPSSPGFQNLYKICLEKGSAGSGANSYNSYQVLWDWSGSHFKIICYLSSRQFSPSWSARNLGPPILKSFQRVGERSKYRNLHLDTPVSRIIFLIQPWRRWSVATAEVIGSNIHISTMWFTDHDQILPFSMYVLSNCCLTA